ncbi:lamin tail domain-containing protein [Streptomyces sp. NPDC059944]|uniref:lamin tail domain-containing protein n=1 Tax=unclassified Streptomyces TaxID=2593676 RepID=UPI0036576955
MSVYTSVPVRRLVAAALAAGALVGSAAVSASAAPGPRAERSPVAISRVQSDAPGVDSRSNRSLNGEWVEVTNSTWRAVSLNGWTLSDRDGNRYTFHQYRLAARSTVRVHTGVGDDTSKDLFQDRRREVWDNRSDVATLKTDHGRVVDSVSWGQRHDRDDDRNNGRGQDHGRDHDRNTGRDHGRDHDRNTGRDHDRNNGRGQDHGRDHDRNTGRDHDRNTGRGQDHGHDQDRDRGRGHDGR